MNKRIKLAAIATTTAALAAGGIIYAMPDKKPVTQLSTQPVSTAQTEVASTDTQPVAQETQTTTPAPTVESAPTPAPTPVYGEDPNNPGIYLVFDKVAVMNSASIAASDQQYVLPIAKAWYYKSNSSNVNLCDAQPASKMSTAGADYETNPVTQLKWCAAYVKARYNTWENAYNFWLKNRFI